MGEYDPLYSDILVELECPICTHYMAPPIRQCETGHSICEPCMKKLPRCPLCQKHFISAKNISLQALAHKVYYPCTNQPLGCNAKLKLEQRENHENNCSFRKFKCAMENCAWTGRLKDVKCHWKSKGKLVRSSFSYCRTNMQTDSYLINLIEAYNQLFWLKRKLEKGRIYWAVQLLGHAHEASKYFYEIQIYESKTSERRIIILRDCCKSNKIDNNDLFNTAACITTVSTERLRHFINKDQALLYYVRIHDT